MIFTLSKENNVEENLLIILRNEWLIIPSHITFSKQELPVKYVKITESNKDICKKPIQSKHDYNDEEFGYNFLISSDGLICESWGWGWDTTITQSEGYTENTIETISIAFIRNFTNLKPDDKQIEAAKSLIEEGKFLKHITHDYELFAHKLQNEDELYNIIKTWPHFNEHRNP